MTSLNSSHAIAPNRFLHSGVNAVSVALLIAFGIALITVSAKIQVPFWPVPMTLQTLAIMAVAAAYGSRLAVTTVLGYLAAGLAGAPVFAGPIAGPAYFAGPTAGFLAGFVVIAALVGYAADRGWGRSPAKLFGSMLAADVICFALGFAWLAFFFVSAKSGSTLGAATAYGIVSQYFLADLVKIAIAALAVPAVGKLLSK